MDHALLAALPGARVLARAPGRVNLIGEHTDYNGFPVLPMAIDRSVTIAARPLATRELVVRSTKADRYAPERIRLDEISRRPRAGTWVDYVVAAARVRAPDEGTELLVAGDVPPQAGLSSSSALVVASLLALGPIGDRAELAEIARRAETYVGTLSGGMDQAISLLARPGYALQIEFRPVRVTSVPMPEALAVVVAHSGVLVAKSGAARESYNARVMQCREAARELGAPAGGLLADVPGDDRVARAARLADPILRRRARFVFAEAHRVGLAADALAAVDLRTLGRLLDESHAGLRDDYQVSHPRVDDLVGRAKQAGAAGARVVGAGFGGCVVAVCARERAAELCAALGPQAWTFESSSGAERLELD